MHTCWNCNKNFVDLHRDEQQDRYYCSECIEVVEDIEELLFEDEPNTVCRDCSCTFFCEDDAEELAKYQCDTCSEIVCHDCKSFCSVDECITAECRSCMGVDLQTFEKRRDGHELFICDDCSRENSFCSYCGELVKNEDMGECQVCGAGLCSRCQEMYDCSHESED